MTTFTISNEYGSVTTPVAKLKNVRCRIEVKPDEEKRKNGEYGFDCLTEKMINNINKSKSIGSISNLEAIYTPIDGLGNSKYYTPWLSLSKNQTVELFVEMTMLEGNKNAALKITDFDDAQLEIKALDDNGNEAKNISSFSKLWIKCLETSEESAEIRFKVNGLVSGGLNIFYPERKKLNLKWYYVGRSDDQDYNQIDRMVSDNNINSFFSRAFNPALIDINIIGAKPQKIDISLDKRNECYQDLKDMIDKYIQDENLKGKDRKIYKMRKYDDRFFSDLRTSEKTMLKNKILVLGSKNGMSDLATNMSKFAHLESLYRCFEEVNGSEPPKIRKDQRIKFMRHLHSSRPDVGFDGKDTYIYLYLTYVSSYDGGVATETPLEVNPGASLVGKEIAIMFLGGKGKVDEFNRLNDSKLRFEPEEDTPHEVMHSLGLEHVFNADNAVHLLLKKSSTDNYMDYENEKNHTFKWQWDQMRKSRFVK